LKIADDIMIVTKIMIMITQKDMITIMIINTVIEREKMFTFINTYMSMNMIMTMIINMNTNIHIDP
jgi:hypothetical protein